MGPPPRPVTTPPLVWDMPVLLLPLQLDTLDTDTVVWDMPLLQLLMVLSPLPQPSLLPQDTLVTELLPHTTMLDKFTQLLNHTFTSKCQLNHTSTKKSLLNHTFTKKSLLNHTFTKK